MIRAGKIKVKKAKENVSPKEIQQVLKEIEGLECEPFFCEIVTAFNETGEIHDGLYWALWTCSKILLPLYFSNPKISGFTDS